MDAKRPPALTSPWKIGFLVSLLLIFLSVGVNYMLFRIFHLSWSWIGLEEGNWFFNKDRFVREMFPLMALIALASLIAYFAITSAVRRYKAYLDSGHDYRNLITMVKGIRDLDDENVIRKLSKYPELRDFLRNVREQAKERDLALAEREDAVAEREQQNVSSDLIRRESESLARAILELSDGGLIGDVKTTVPDLMPIEKAIHGLANSGGAQPGAVDLGKLHGVRKDVDEAIKYLKSRLAESSKEHKASCSVAQEIENQLSQLNAVLASTGGVTPAGAGGTDFTGLVQSMDTIERLSLVLADLGEEAKGIAINTALQAGSGEGAVADLIQLAEDVRGVALKFTDMAQSYQEAIEQMRKSMAGVEASRATPAGECEEGRNVAQVASALKSKVSLWVERMVVLSDQIKNVEKSLGLTFGPLQEKLANLREEGAKLSVEPTGKERAAKGLQVETAGGGSPEEDLQVETSAPPGLEQTKSASTVFSQMGAPSQDIPGLESNTGQVFDQEPKEGEMFAELSKADSIEKDEDVTFEEISSEKLEKQRGTPLRRKRQDPSESEPPEETIAIEPPSSGSPLGGPAGEDTASADTFEGKIAFDLSKATGSEAQDSEDSEGMYDHNAFSFEDMKTAGRQQIPAQKADWKGALDGATDEEEVIDLYELGAVDFV
ncbi:MAG: hypothetical protein GTO51_10525 [Candidatus Latescibacteria bacterium]|nr:hypothetical protein [Candidatus Latescibacterota bacterium]NIM66403.1 hypothetical protein [Candidatus Latescibacterota bacterium]NIO02882.1 hypothetical protein [Candidatus Latescibacterota bacterium]NIO30017.1 hypothetical protein [Candidatus Latescibacterota bacterium]NIO57632.1 hypothetical protein [Candidatus Latescibacterota bacterium]